MLHTLRRTRLSPPVQQSRWLPSVAWEPSIRCVNRASNLLAYSVSDGALPSGAADPRLPSVAGWAPRPSLELCCILGDGRGSPSRCSRAAGSLQSQREPPIRHVKPRLVPAARGTLPSGAAKPKAPFGLIWHLPSCSSSSSMQGSPVRRCKPQLPSCTARAHQSPCLLFICRLQSISLHSRHILGRN